MASWRDFEMEDDESVKAYFEKNAESWLLDAYEQAGFNYPTPYHRLRVVKECIPRLDGVHRILDVGCGGGQVTFDLAEAGFEVLGIDQSATMIERANAAAAKLSEATRSRVAFQRKSLEEVRGDAYDVTLAMGLIGYLSSDEFFFERSARLLRDQGYAIVSFRNRLFNLYSISDRTIKEIEGGHFLQLAQEAGRTKRKDKRRKRDGVCLAATSDNRNAAQGRCFQC